MTSPLHKHRGAGANPHDIPSRCKMLKINRGDVGVGVRYVMHNSAHEIGDDDGSVWGVGVADRNDVGGGVGPQMGTSR